MRAEKRCEMRGGRDVEGMGREVKREEQKGGKIGK